MAIGGESMKPKDDERIPLEPGKHSVVIDDVDSGVSDKTGSQYWFLKLSDSNVQFQHFIGTEETQYKSMDKVFNHAAKQMESLGLYDTIGEQPDYDSWFQKAIDLTFQLKGKSIEYTVQKYKIDGKEGKWGMITGFLDTPNEAIQKFPDNQAPQASGPAPGVNENEEIPF